MCCLFPCEEPHGVSAQARFMRWCNMQGQLLCTCCARSRLKGLVVVFALVCMFVCEGLHVSEAGFAGQHTFSISGRGRRELELGYLFCRKLKREFVLFSVSQR